MPRKGKRLRVAAGIYRDGRGLAAVVKVGPVQREKRYPLGSDLHDLKQWQETTKATLKRKQPLTQRGGFERDAKRYINQVKHLASWKARNIEVNAWIAEFGHRHRSTIKTADVLRTRADWLAQKVAPKTVNNRVQTLRHLYRTLDGKHADTPCDDLSPLPVHKTPAIVITDAKVCEVEQTLAGFESVKRLPDQKTRARFRVLASTGKRPSEMMRAQPSDVDLGRRVWVVRDGKGGYSPGLYLNDDMIAAWSLFVAADAWGPYNTNSFARTLRSAGWLKGVRPYNLRHTTWIMAMERGADARDVQAGAGHKRFETTQRHYVGVRNSRMQKLSELLEGRFGWGVPSDRASATPENPRES